MEETFAEAKAPTQVPPKEVLGPERLELLANIASWYFENDMTQSEIAARTGYSPSMVSRLLSEARRHGIVEFRVHHPIERRVDLEQELAKRLGLLTTRVVACGSLDYLQMIRRLGSVTARLVEETVHSNMTIGIAWGPAVYETINDLRRGRWSGIHVVQLISSLGTSEPEVNGQELARRMADAFGGGYTALAAPLFVDSEATRQALLKDIAIGRAVELFRTTDLALVGVGTLDPRRCSLLRYGHLTLKQLEDLRNVGAVGDVCGVYVDRNGKPVESPLTKQMFGIDAALLKAIPKKIGVAGGESKIEPIIGACRAQFIDVLVTDEVAATGVLREQC